MPSIITQLKLRFTPFTGDPLVCNPANTDPANIFSALVPSFEPSNPKTEPVAAFFISTTSLITAITETQFEHFVAITIFARGATVIVFENGQPVEKFLTAEEIANRAVKALLNGNKTAIRVGGPGEPIRLSFAAFGSLFSCSH